MKFLKSFFFLVFLLSVLKCSNSSGPSCTLWTEGACYDYAGTTWSYQVAAEELCTTALGIWSTDGCPYSNCGTADTNGQIECTE